MKPWPRTLRAALLLLLVAVWTGCTSSITPAPDPQPTPAPTLAPGPGPSPGAGALGQIAVPVPATVGTSVTWTAATFVSLTSASPATFSSGDTITVWGSSTGLEATSPGGGYVAQGWVAGTGWSWSTSPLTWTSWPYFAITRQTNGAARTVYLNGDLGSTPGGGDAGAAEAVNVLSATGVLINPATADNQTNGTQVANPSSVTPVLSSGLVSSFVIKASAGTHLSTFVQVDATATTGTYYVQMFDGTASCPADTTPTASNSLHAPITVVHTSGTPDRITFNDVGARAVFLGGLCVVLSSTQFTKTATSAWMLVDASVL